MFKQYGNLFENLIEIQKTKHSKPTVDYIIHGCNDKGVMGSGFAKELKQRFPGAYEIYRKAYEILGEDFNLGEVVSYQKASGPILENKIIVCNCVTQEDYGYDGKMYTSYDAIDTACKHVVQSATVFKGMGYLVRLHYPKIGCGLGGANWNVVKEILEANFKDFPHYYHEFERN